MTIRRLCSLGLVGFVGLALVACSSTPVTISHIFQAPPWTTNESLNYNLVGQGGHVDGTCDLTTTINISPGRTRLQQLCQNSGTDAGRYEDNRTTIVESATLKPISATRSIIDKQKKTNTTFTSTYSDTKVTYKANQNGNLNQTTRALPTPDKVSPDPGYYDDETLFWLIRGIPLRKGWQGAYMDYNASNGNMSIAQFTVQDQEKVTVPAGTFSAWKVQFATSSATQYFWVQTQAPHQVLKAEVEQYTYELTSAH